jgi:hypothetical protein
MAISTFANEKSPKDFFNLVALALAYSDVFWCLHIEYYVYSRYALCLLLQILLVAALDIKTRDVPTVSSAVTILQSFAFFCKFLCTGGGGATVRFAPVVPWAKTGPVRGILFLLSLQLYKSIMLNFRTFNEPGKEDFK